MKVTDVKIQLTRTSQKYKAFASVLLDDCLMLTGLRVIEGSNGDFVAYPNDPGHKGEDYRQMFYPITCELREHIETEVLKACREEMDK